MINSNAGPKQAQRSPAQRFRFGDFELDAANDLLLAKGTPVSLGKRALDVLKLLLEGRGALVTKEDLLERAWRGAIVVENALHAQVSALRKALGSNIVETVPGRGYRICIEVITASEGDRTIQHLPNYLSSFLGREAEVRTVVEHLKQLRLVTLTGVGGCGKTRLAVEAAAQAMAQAFVSATFVGLESIDDPLLVPQVTATALGLRDKKGEALITTISAHIAGQRVLLVLDNAEHVLQACASLVRGRHRSPGTFVKAVCGAIGGVVDRAKKP